MSVYPLFQNVIAAQSAPSPSNPFPTSGNNVINPNDGSPPGPQLSQTFQLVVGGTSGTVSCNAQPIVSNDGINWSSYGAALAVTAAAYPTSTVSSMNGAYNYFGAYVVSISGTGANATMLMSA